MITSRTHYTDVWNADCQIHDQVPQTCEDMGLSKSDLVQLTQDYQANMEKLRKATLAAGKFSWQMLWTGGADNNMGSTCPKPLVTQANCASALRQLCSATSPSQTRGMMYSFRSRPPNCYSCCCKCCDLF